MKRDSNRAAMPTVAAFVDEIRAQGFSVKVLYASENGKGDNHTPPCLRRAANLATVMCCARGNIKFPTQAFCSTIQYKR